MQKQVLSLLKTSRPRFWIYLLGPFLLGWTAGMLPQPLDASLTEICFLLLGMVFLAFPANLFVYGVNDLYDQETDRLNAKKQGYETTLEQTSVKLVRHGVLLAFLVGTLLCILAAINQSLAQALFLLGGWFGFSFFSWQYSAPPIRAKARPFLDSAFNILYVFPSLIGYGLTRASEPSLAWQPLVAAWLWCMAMHAFSAVPDIEADREAHLQTIATTLGKQKTILLCSALYVSACSLVWPWLQALSIIGALIYLGIMARALTQKNDTNLLRLYRLFPWINSGLGLLIWLRVLFL